jgi:hypothetical protein
MSKDGYEYFLELLTEAAAMFGSIKMHKAATRLEDIIQSGDFVELMGLHLVDGYSEFIRRFFDLSQMHHYCRMCLSNVSSASLDFNLTKALTGDLFRRVDSLKN